MEDSVKVIEGILIDLQEIAEQVVNGEDKCLKAAMFKIGWIHSRMSLFLKNLKEQETRVCEKES
jgi:hypothetical protein